MPAVAVDASLAVKVAVPEEFSEETRNLFTGWARSGIDVVAPHLIIEEMTNSVYKRVRARHMTLAQGQGALAVLLALDIQIDDVNASRALLLAHEHQLPTACDGFYLVLAEAHGCEFWTADERLYNAVRGHLPWVHWVGEYRQMDV